MSIGLVLKVGYGFIFLDAKLKKKGKETETHRLLQEKKER